MNKPTLGWYSLKIVPSSELLTWELLQLWTQEPSIWFMNKSFRLVFLKSIWSLGRSWKPVAQMVSTEAYNAFGKCGKCRLSISKIRLKRKICSQTCCGELGLMSRFLVNNFISVCYSHKTWNMSHMNHFNVTFMVLFYCHQQRMHANACNLHIWHPPPANHSVSISKWVSRQLVTTDVGSWPREGDIDQTDLSRSFTVEHGTGNGFKLIRFWSICVATLFTEASPLWVINEIVSK